MSDVLLVQNTRIEGSGYLGDLHQNDVFEIKSVNAKHEQLQIIIQSLTKV